MSEKYPYKKSQLKRLGQAAKLAGPRYTPELNVGVGISSIFEGLGRTEKFYTELKKSLPDLVRHIQYVSKPEIDIVAHDELVATTTTAQKVADLLLRVPVSGVNKIDSATLHKLCDSGMTLVRNLISVLQKDERVSNEPGSKDPNGTKQQSEKHRSHIHDLWKIFDALHSISVFVESLVVQAANSPQVLLTGAAGSGKTHFLCDLAKKRIEAGFPTYIFLGEEFSESRKPLNTVKKLLGFKGGDGAFLESINRYAASKRVRAVIIIDAINEAQIRGIRWDQLCKVNQYNNLAVIISVRTGFEQQEVPKKILDGFLKVTHRGFVGNEWEAYAKFFSKSGLPLPETPLLTPEFHNPLFLKIYCSAASKAPNPVRGNYGFRYIFEKYVIAQGEGVLKQLGEPGQSNRRVWDGVIKEIALEMGDSGLDRLHQKRTTSIVAKQFPGKARDAIVALEKQFLLIKVPRYRRYKIVGYDYRFPYEKFSDHLIVRALINKYLDKTNPKKSLIPGTKLGEIIRRDRNYGLIEALAIQIPQDLKGRELVYVAPKKFRFQSYARNSFLESLIWRDLSTRSNGQHKFIKTKLVLDFINKYLLPFERGKESVLEVLLTVAAVPEHPLNAHILHKHLLRMPMPKRDAYWLPFINERYANESIFDRYLAWAWYGGDKTKISEESVGLAATVLSWCLASSNRFLRDRATKALVSILYSRPEVLLRLLKRFELVDDPYIQERLFAVTYGCILQVGVPRAGVLQLAHYTYERIFKKGAPPKHILWRDYARNIVETAAAIDPAFEGKVDLRMVRPPYRSRFPTKVPSTAVLKKKYYRDYRKNKSRRGDYNQIWFSLMYNNGGSIADFGNYIVNSTVGNWCNLRLKKNGQPPKFPKQISKEFEESLDEFSKKIWARLEEARQSIATRRLFEDLPVKLGTPPKKTGTSSNDGIEIKARELILNELERSFINTLDPHQRNLYRKGILKTREGRWNLEIDRALVQRIIFTRIIELGWNPRLFDKYDGSVRERGRDAHKAERIGKKYQWIAFHETLGLIADNFALRDGFSDEGGGDYQGAWQIWRRDIDPSYIVPPSFALPPKAVRPWWSPSNYSSWRLGLGHTEWTKITDDLPQQRKLLEIKTNGGWLLLDGYLGWDQPTAPGIDRYDAIRRNVWYHIHSYLIKADKVGEILDWAKKQNFLGRWVPEPLELRDVFIREIPNGFPYQHQYGTAKDVGWRKVTEKVGREEVFEVIVAAEEYHWEGGGFDCSLNDGVMIRVPCKEIVSGMNLSQSQRLGTFVNANGDEIIQDVAAESVEKSALLIKKRPFLKFLEENGYALLWITFGEKLLLGTAGGGQGFLGRLEVGGAHILSSEGRIFSHEYTNWSPPHTKG